jgi:MFS transporter, DHA1 family, inner membrane transport protein
MTIDRDPSEQPASLPLARLLVLALAVAATVTAELIPAGLLPEMGRDLRASPSQVGLLVTAWALTIIVVSVPLTRLTRHRDRRSLIVAALIVFAVANLGTAVAPTIEFALVTRIVAAAAHALFWSIVMAYAAAMSPRALVGRAVTLVAGGASVATVIGVPGGAAIGSVLGWRLTFAVLAVAMVAVAVTVRLAMPPAAVGSLAAVARGARTRDRSLRRIVLVAGIGGLVTLANFLIYTYVGPLLVSLRIDESWLSLVLLVFGVAGFGGLVLVGVTADRWPTLSLSIPLALLAIALLWLFFARDLSVLLISCAVWGFAMGALPPILQATALRVASESRKSLAGATLLMFFNAGIGLGALVGGRFEAGGILLTGVLLAAVVSVIATVLSLVLARSSRRARGEKASQPR